MPRTPSALKYIYIYIFPLSKQVHFGLPCPGRGGGGVGSLPRDAQVRDAADGRGAHDLQHGGHGVHPVRGEKKRFFMGLGK